MLKTSELSKSSLDATVADGKLNLVKAEKGQAVLHLAEAEKARDAAKLEQEGRLEATSPLEEQRAQLKALSRQVQEDNENQREELRRLQQQKMQTDPEIFQIREKLERLKALHSVLVAANEPLAERPATVTSPRPLLTQVYEAGHVEEQNRSLLEQQLAQITANTAELRSESKAKRKETDEWALEIETMKQEQLVLTALLVGSEGAIETTENEISHMKLQCQVMKQIHDMGKTSNLKKASGVTNLADTLGSKRQGLDTLRSSAQSEMHNAHSVVTRTHKIQKRVALEHKSVQKELVSMASAHSELIAASSGVGPFPPASARAYVDLSCPEVRSTIFRAAMPPPRSPTMLQTQRTDLRCAAHLILASPRA